MSRLELREGQFDWISRLLPFTWTIKFGGPFVKEITIQTVLTVLLRIAFWLYSQIFMYKFLLKIFFENNKNGGCFCSWAAGDAYQMVRMPVIFLPEPV